MKKIVLFLVLPVLVFSLGCAEIGEFAGDLQSSSAGKTPKVVRSATLESEWAMKQVELKMGADEEIEILLKLSAGDEVDGYFYLESGTIYGFDITGNSSLYMIKQETGEDGVSSGRFSFTATEDEGTTYTLMFSTRGDEAEVKTSKTIFLEIIYPKNGSLFIPVQTE